MNDISLIALLERSLNAQEVSWVVAALRQDELIWRCIAGVNGMGADLRARVLAQGASQAEAWSPAALALIALDLPHTPQRLRADIQYPLESRLRRKIVQAAAAPLAPQPTPEGKEASGAGFDEESAGLEDLARAGLLALALRERRRLMGSWEGLPYDLDKMALPNTPVVNFSPGLPLSFWKTPLACLFGLIPDPLEMLVSLVPPGATADQHALVVHALLANPLSPEKAVQLFQGLLSRVPWMEGIALLRELAFHRPELAARLSLSALEGSRNRETPLIDGHLPLDPLDDIRRLEWLIGQWLVKKAVPDPPETLMLLNTACEIAMHLHTELIAQSALACQKEDLTASLAAWEQAVHRAPDNLYYRTGLVLALIDAGRLEEARQWLAEPANAAGGTEAPGQTRTGAGDNPTGPAYLQSFAAARLAAANGELAQAMEYARKVKASMLVESQAPKPPFQLLSPTAIPRFLMEIGLGKEAAEVACHALNSRPADLDLLSLAGEAWSMAGQIEMALEPLLLAVSLAPERASLRRQYAAALEAYAASNGSSRGAWEAALAQRAAVCDINAGHPSAETGGESLPPTSLQALDDLRLLASCALHAGQVQRAMDACRQALALDAEDGLTHTLLGQALAAADDLPAAREHLLQATRLVPAMAESWLALAQVLRQSGQPQRALETLRSAAQANPDSAEIQLALGEAYREDWEEHGAPSPTQALVYYQRAAALAPDNVCIGLRLGETLFTLGHLLEARQALERAYLADPGFPGLAFAYSRVLLAQGETAQALPILTRVIADPAYTKDPTPHLDYARTLLAVNSTASKVRA